MGTTATGAAAAGPPPPIFSEYRDPTGVIDLAAVRHQGHSYLADGSTARLFDLVADPGEDHDVAAANPGVTVALGADLARWGNECRTLAATLGPVDAATVPRPEVVDQLRALGYVD